MLSNKELYQFLQQQQVYKKPFNITSAKHHLVFEVPTGRILYSSRSPFVIKKVAEFALNTGSYVDISSRAFTSLFDNTRPYNYIFERSVKDETEDKLGRPRVSKVDLWPDDPNLYYYALVAEKGFAIDYILDQIASMRRRSQNDLMLQYQVYQMKIEEARNVVSQGLTELDDTTYFRFPFVHSYAELEGFNLQEAAEEIILQHTFFKSWLASVEELRLKYIKMVAQETEIENIVKIITEFQNQGRPYGQL